MLITDYIDRGARIAPQAPALVSPDGSVQMSHQRFEDLSHRVAAALLAGGLQPGDRVAVLSPNDPLAFACISGVMRAGGVWTAASTASGEAELTDFLTAAGCNRLIFHASMARRAGQLLERVDGIASAVSIGPTKTGCPELEQWMAPEGERASPPSPGSAALAMMIGTGGTTGKPKGVPVTHRQFQLMCLAFNTHLAEPEPPRYICATPMTHAAGVAAFPVLAEGGSVIVHQGVKPAEILASIERNQATRIFLPPTALYTLLAQPGVRDHDYRSLRHLLIAAAPIAPERLAEAVNVFGPVLVQVYGQSEAPFILTSVEVALRGRRRYPRCMRCGRVAAVLRVPEPVGLPDPIRASRFESACYLAGPADPDGLARGS